MSGSGGGAGEGSNTGNSGAALFILVCGSACGMCSVSGREITAILKKNVTLNVSVQSYVPTYNSDSVQEKKKLKENLKIYLKLLPGISLSVLILTFSD